MLFGVEDLAGEAGDENNENVLTTVACGRTKILRVKRTLKYCDSKLRLRFFPPKHELFAEGQISASDEYEVY